ncbi:hypothetical protein KCP78_24470 [Salmonella enterica subsp. enterica]|nr:hypothetical protein KCP78_24470 [Salmonella enterica subsp. enterica]
MRRRFSTNAAFVYFTVTFSNADARAASAVRNLLMPEYAGTLFSPIIRRRPDPEPGFSPAQGRLSSRVW